MVFGYFFALLGILSVIYGIAMAMGAHGTMFFMIWFFIGAFLIGDGILRIKKITLPTVPVMILRITVIALLVLFIFVECCIISRFRTTTDETVEYVLIAGAQVFDYGPSPVLKFRLDAAVDYLKAHDSSKCIATGGKGSNEPRTEAAVIEEYLVSHGISKERILLEDRSTNTTENMQNALALYDIKDSSVAIVTNNFHLFRCMKIAKKQGMNNLYGIAADSTLLYLPNNLLREFLGVCKDFLFGHM